MRRRDFLPAATAASLATRVTAQSKTAKRIPPIGPAWSGVGVGHSGTRTS